MISVEVRKVLVQVEREDGSVFLSDGIIRNERSLASAVVPFCINVTEHCFVKVSV